MTAGHTGLEPVLLVAHGSADPRAAASTRALARAVAAQRPGLDVRTSYLDHAGPRPDTVLFDLQRAGHRAASVVPLLLTAAFHGRVDLPGVIGRAHADGLSLRVRTTDVLGPVGGVVHPLLLAALRRRLPPPAPDGVVLVAAGTRDDLARQTVDLAADAFGRLLGVPCRAAFASGSPVTGEVAVSALRQRGCARVAVASYFLAPGGCTTPRSRPRCPRVPCNRSRRPWAMPSSWPDSSWPGSTTPPRRWGTWPETRPWYVTVTLEVCR